MGLIFRKNTTFSDLSSTNTIGLSVSDNLGIASTFQKKIRICGKTQHKAQLFSGLYTVLKGKLKPLFHPSC